MIEENKIFLQEKLRLNSFEDYMKFPMYYEIETINACNAECQMCTINKWQSHKNPLMSDELFKKIADELIENKNIVRTVNLCRDGEPLMDKGLEKKINYLKDGGIKHTTFSTNASLLNEDRAVSLIDSKLDEIMFSIDGYKKETFETIRLGLKYEKVAENVKSFVKLRDRHNSKIKVRVRMVIQELNKNEVDDWGRYWRDIVGKDDVVHAKNIHSWGNQLDGFSGIRDYKKLQTPCTSTFSTMIIRYNGDVTICPLDFDFKYKNGNLSDKSIKEIWQGGENFKIFRNVHLSGERDEFEFCKGCRLWDADESKREF